MENFKKCEFSSVYLTVNDWMDVKNEYKIRLTVSFGCQTHICWLSAAPCL